ncbi:sensor histidine kinase [Ruminiclostridium papyrosolvens]|uniref:Histidine kinase n=1 Tax=Ruminiclostridium papyrosolvens C7 TaxID=1330534 RepID=U4R5H3_9FIRM|nr:ATP-binding protein [Ruminiclostridium papyrosolvens]EPR13831.1 histidine kinase [Ruminiclostridium papyrosolvens C7]
MYLANELFLTVIEGLIFIIAFYLLSGQRQFIRKIYTRIAWFVTIYTIYTYWITKFLPSGLHSLLIASLTCFILNYILNGTLFKSVVKVLIIFLGMAIIESLIGLACMSVTGKPMSVLIDNNVLLAVLGIIAKLIESTIVFVLYKSHNGFSWLKDGNPYQSRYKQTLIMIFAVLFFLVGTNIYISKDPQNLLLYNIFTFVIYIVLIIAMLSAFREGSKLEILQYANELKKENVYQLISFNEMVAKERHEYKNHLNTIYGLCTLNRPDLSDKVKQYINNYANNSETMNINVCSGNDFVDAIISVKYNNALKKDVEVLVDFEEPLSSAVIDEDTAVTVISNIIDNAYESILGIDKEKKFIRLETYIENDNYYMSISNNGPMIPEAIIKKIFSAGYSTKDNASKKRGFGLSIVQAQIDKCGGSIEINSDEELTEFLITLKVNSQAS